MVDKTTGYIKINRFAEKTYDEFLSGLTQLKKKVLNILLSIYVIMVVVIWNQPLQLQMNS